MNSDFIVGLIIICLVVYFFINFRKSIKITRDTVVTFTGTLGSGKTFNAVKLALLDYRIALLKWYLKKAITPRKKLPEKPLLISNIPIKIGRGYSYKLTKDMLLFCEKIPYKSVVLIDEIGQIASQNDYDNGYVVEDLQKLIRFFRHVVNGRLILTDQSSSNIVVQLRRRIGKVYSLSNFRKKMFFFYKTDVHVLEFVDDNVQNVNILNNNETPFLFGIIGRTFKKYDSRCYSILYDDVPNLVKYRWYMLKTKDFIELPFRKWLRGERNAKRSQ